VSVVETQVRFQTKTEWVYRRIRDMITSGRVRSGERLRLTQLADDLQVSEMPVREALRMLQRDGMIVFKSHRGATVADVTWEAVYQAVLVRMYLEVLATETATPHFDQRRLRKLGDLVERMEQMAEKGQSLEFSRANRIFHQTLYEPCPYSLLRDEIERLWDQMWRSRSGSLFALHPERMQQAQVEHHAIFRAVAAGDPTAAAAAAEEHRVNTLAVWAQIVNENPTWSQPGGS
jgi:DNA-binding GntR family transcriptional regulator